MKQNNYDFITGINEKLYLELIQRGIVPINIMTYRTIYECYLNELKKYKKTVAITYCAEKYRVTERTIRNAIKFMKCEPS